MGNTTYKTPTELLADVFCRFLAESRSRLALVHFFYALEGL
jgi:hypothetical protein